ncbi:HAD family hydrolase [Mycobacterium sp. 3519A]|uniref:HAD family hydrolase n=1 Tax=Mycobacterium sp. 3519A TaxID=2057184 RepID=UPI0013595F3E|nr:HAD family hydrolase [Mycobacterium sp. 3519A]
MFFDFFGTLVDYDPSIFPRYNAPLAFARRAESDLSEAASDAHWQHAWDTLDAEAARSGREFSMYQVARRYWRAIGSPSLPANAIETLIAEYLDAWSAGVVPAAHAVDCVSDLASDHTLAVVSNTHAPGLVQGLVRRFGLHRAIDRVITSVDVGWRKPHRGIFDAALKSYGTTAADVVFVGDNWEADVVGPREMGMSTVYVGRPGVSLKELPAVVRSLRG